MGKNHGADIMTSTLIILIGSATIMHFSPQAWVIMAAIYLLSLVIIKTE